MYLEYAGHSHWLAADWDARAAGSPADASLIATVMVPAFDRPNYPVLGIGWPSASAVEATMFLFPWHEV